MGDHTVLGAVLDEFTRECLALPVGRQFYSDDVLARLTYLFNTHRPPEHIRSSQGSEFIAKVVKEWLGRIRVRTLYIEKAGPWENGYDESFNGKLRDELLNVEIFYTLAEAGILIEAWRRHYNTKRRIARSAIGPRCRKR